MSSVARLHTVIFALCVALGLAGCSSTAGKSWGCGGGTAGRVEDRATIDYTIERLTCDDRVYMVLAANGCSGGGSGGGSGNSRGGLYAKDGRLISWSCSTSDAKGGKVVIDGKEFDLAGGGLFLVSTKETPTRIEQVPLDAGQLQTASDTKTFPELATADARIAAFLQSCKDTK